MDMAEMKYLIAEYDYIAKMRTNEKYKNLDEMDCRRVLFPNNWFNCNAYEKKLEIIKQAMEQGIRVTELPESLDFEEGVRYSK